VKCSAITGPVFERHNRRGHIECQDRLSSIVARLPADITCIEPIIASREDVERVHNPGYLKWLEKQCVRNLDYAYLDDFGCSGGYFAQNTFIAGFIDPNTYVNPLSYEVALYAAGSSIAAMERALDGENCFALVRPPGHHAAADWAMGFCLLNNTAIAAAKALMYVDRVAIIDWDNHHGNGTQDIFYGNDRVTYCSLHEEDVFPNTGTFQETGTGAGQGHTLNAPLQRGCTIGDYSVIFTEIILPFIEREKPDCIIISAGQDILSDDPVGNMALVPGDFGYMTGLVQDTLDLPLALILEGGYGPSQPEAVAEIFSALKGKRQNSSLPQPLQNTRSRIPLLKKIHRLA
jgi:acetoin utilization deacetylase AcuC-like enzyme